MADVQVAAGAGVAGDLPRQFVQEAVAWALEKEDAGEATISVALISDGEIAEINERYLSHAGPTDVISFPLTVEGSGVVGDIYIGIDQAIRQAAENQVELDEELARLAIHGTLHVLGYDHPEAGSREDSDMYQRQEKLLADYIASGRGER